MRFCNQAFLIIWAVIGWDKTLNTLEFLVHLNQILAVAIAHKACWIFPKSKRFLKGFLGVFIPMRAFRKIRQNRGFRAFCKGL